MIAIFAQLLVRLGTGIASRFRNGWYKALGVDIRGYCWMRSIEIPRNWRDIILDRCSLDRGVTLLCTGPQQNGKLTIGRGTYINRHCIFDAHQSILVGEDVMIGPFCMITDANHGTKLGSTIRSQPMIASPVVIEDGAWIGSHVTILPGVHVGRGAVIGAGSVVTRNIPPNTIAFGSPATPRGERQPSNHATT